MSAITTSAPARASVSASARPSPRDPPVTKPTRPERSISITRRGTDRSTRRDSFSRHEQFSGDDEPLDLRGAFVDLEELRVSHQLLHRILLHVPVATEDL